MQKLYLSIFEWVDYIPYYESVFCLLFLPFLRVNKWLNPWLIYAWIYSSIATHFFRVRGFSFNMSVGMDVWRNSFMIFLLLFVLLMRTKVDSEKIAKGLSRFGLTSLILSLVCVPFSIYFNDVWLSGFIPNKSMNAVFNIAIFSYVLDRYQKYHKLLWVILLSVVLGAKSSMGYLTLGIFFISYFYKEIKEMRLKHSFIFGSFLLGVLCATYIKLFDPEVFKTGDRFFGYRLFFKVLSPIDWVFGMGPSSFFTIGSKIQKMTHFQENWAWVYMHSDPLQYIFEFGVIGVIPLAYALWGVFKHGKRREILAIISLITSGIFYYPMHFPIHLILFFFVMKLIVDIKTSNDVEEVHKCNLCGEEFDTNRKYDIHRGYRHPDAVLRMSTYFN